MVSSDKFTNPEDALPLELFSLETTHCFFYHLGSHFQLTFFCPYNRKKKKLMKYTPFKDCENEKNAYKELSAGPGSEKALET